MNDVGGKICPEMEYTDFVRINCYISKLSKDNLRYLSYQERCRIL